MRPRGFVVDRASNAVWGMQFVWPIKADYRIAYLSEDRKRYGLALPMDVESNVVMASLSKFTGLKGATTSLATASTPEAAK